MVAELAAPEPEHRIHVRAVALRAGDRWLIAVQHSSPVTVEVAQLEDVDDAVGKALGEQLGLNVVPVSVDLQWFRGA